MSTWQYARPTYERVFGNDSDKKVCQRSRRSFQQCFQCELERLGHQPCIFDCFPELADDTYATIGLTGPASTSALMEPQIPPS